MSSNAKVVSTKIIKTLMRDARQVKVAYVDQTDTWKRIHLDQNTQNSFVEHVDQNFSSLREDTDIVALQESPHTSNKDNRTHFTAVEINNQGSVVSKRHLKVKQTK